MVVDVRVDAGRGCRFTEVMLGEEDTILLGLHAFIMLRFVVFFHVVEQMLLCVHLLLFMYDLFLLNIDSPIFKIPSAPDNCFRFAPLLSVVIPLLPAAVKGCLCCNMT